MARGGGGGGGGGGDVEEAIRLEGIAIALVSLAVSVWWEICLLGKFNYPWISPVILLTGLDVYMFYAQYPVGFSLRELGFRMLTQVSVFFFAFILVTLLYAVGLPVPDNADSLLMIPYAVAYVFGFVAIFRFLITIFIVVFKAAGVF